MPQHPVLPIPPEFWEWRRKAAICYLSSGWYFSPASDWQKIDDVAKVREQGHQIDEKRFACLFPEVVQHLHRLPNYAENKRPEISESILAAIQHCLTDPTPDWWGVPPMRDKDFRLPSMKGFPTPEPLCYRPGETHRYGYTSGVRMMGESNMAKRRLTGLRTGAWVISPRTSHRWANWRGGEIEPVRPEFYLPSELRIPACRCQPITGDA